MFVGCITGKNVGDPVVSNGLFFFFFFVEGIKEGMVVGVSDKIAEGMKEGVFMVVKIGVTLGMKIGMVLGMMERITGGRREWLAEEVNESMKEEILLRRRGSVAEKLALGFEKKELMDKPLVKNDLFLWVPKKLISEIVEFRVKVDPLMTNNLLVAIPFTR